MKDRNLAQSWVRLISRSDSQALPSAMGTSAFLHAHDKGSKFFTFHPCAPTPNSGRSLSKNKEKEAAKAGCSHYNRGAERGAFTGGVLWGGMVIVFHCASSKEPLNGSIKTKFERKF